ncbi:hypothetical protein KIW84_044093 [Lathyrus oleraceus]|uniref:Uncharacterized protein n=1 Tax=Pisum sativum TaxID=3888 RepID=A0A9D5ASK5_PEA|nr:hypothetical protein KIW84_044093 [Pisum sativum]
MDAGSVLSKDLEEVFVVFRLEEEVLIANFNADEYKDLASIEGGARLGSDLMAFTLVFNFAAIVCQYLSSRVVVITGRDLAQICSDGPCFAYLSRCTVINGTGVTQPNSSAWLCSHYVSCKSDYCKKNSFLIESGIPPCNFVTKGNISRIASNHNPINSNQYHSRPSKAPQTTSTSNIHQPAPGNPFKHQAKFNIQIEALSQT